MSETPLRMSREEREAFLADLHIGVLSIPEPGRGPLTAPIWYAYQPGGEIELVTGKDSRKAHLLEKAERVSFVVQTETLPYQYVSVEGPVTAFEPADVDAHVRPIAHRYLGAEGGDAYLASTRSEDGEGGDMLVRIRPERWLTVDYSKRFSA